MVSSDRTRVQESAREAVRRKWAEADSNSIPTGVKPSSSAKSKDQKKTVQCPVCGKGFLEADIKAYQINVILMTGGLNSFSECKYMRMNLDKWWFIYQ